MATLKVSVIAASIVKPTSAAHLITKMIVGGRNLI
jgi:hypothetical protein